MTSTATTKATNLSAINYRDVGNDPELPSKNLVTSATGLTSAVEPQRTQEVSTVKTVSRYRLKLEREEVEHAEVEHRPSSLARFFWDRVFEHLDREAVVTAFFGADGRLTGWNLAYIGGLTEARVEPRGIVVPALLANAAAIIIAHNHPSGDPTPSKEDIALTLRIAQACKILGLSLNDSLILAEGKKLDDPPMWVSLRDRLAF